MGNRRSEYKLATKHMTKKNQVDFEEFSAYDQELSSGYYNKDMIFLMDGITLPNGTKQYNQSLDKCTLIIVHICRHLCMELCLDFGALIPMIK